MGRTTPSSEREGVDVASPEDGRPIVFVHGAAFTRAMWAPQREVLADEFRVIAPDLPGHGARSDADFRLEAAVERLDRVVDAHADGGVLLVGLSLGGYVSTAYASRSPDRVDGLVLSGSSANPVDSLATLTRAVGGLARLATRSDRIEGGVRKLAARWVRKRGLPPEQERELIESGFYPRQFGVAGRELAGRDFRGALAEYPGPVLVLNGEKDLVNRRAEERHAAAAPDGRIEVLEGAGHTCNLHRPDAYTSAVRRFHDRAVAEHAEVR